MQEIIVYRSPGEKALWDFAMSGDGFIFICVLFSFFVFRRLLTYCYIIKVMGVAINKDYVACVLAVCVAVLVFVVM